MSTPRRRNREGKQGAFRGEQYDLGRIREPTHLHLRGVRVVVSWEKRFCVVAASTDPRYCRDERLPDLRCRVYDSLYEPFYGRHDEVSMAARNVIDDHYCLEMQRLEEQLIAELREIQ